MDNMIVEVFKKAVGGWLNVDFGELKDSDIFRLYVGKDRFTDEYGNNVWVVNGNPSLDKNGKLVINMLY